MNDQPVERTRHISITRTGADGMVSQTEVHITAVHHRSVDTGSASASVQATCISLRRATVLTPVPAATSVNRR